MCVCAWSRDRDRQRQKQAHTHTHTHTHTHCLVTLGFAAAIRMLRFRARPLQALLRQARLPLVHACQAGASTAVVAVCCQHLNHCLHTHTHTLSLSTSLDLSRPLIPSHPPRAALVLVLHLQAVLVRNLTAPGTSAFASFSIEGEDLRLAGDDNGTLVGVSTEGFVLF